LETIGIAFVVTIAAVSAFLPAQWQTAIPALSGAIIIGALGSRALIGFILVFSGVSLGFATGNDPTLLAEAGGTSLDGLRLLVVLGAFAFVVVRDRELLLGLKHVFPYLLFVGFAALSVLWSPVPGLGIRSLVKLLYPIVGFLIVFRLASTASIGWVEQLILVAALLGTVSNLVVRLAGLSVFTSFEGRYYGAWHPNLMGMFCTATAIPLLSWGMARRKYLYIGTGIIVLIQLALTGSRTMFLAGGVGLAVVTLIRRKYALVVLLAAIALGTWVLLPALGSRSEAVDPADVGLAPTTLGPVQNFSGRLLLWADVWTNLVPGAEGIGRGLGATAAYLQARYLVGKHAHNTYLEVLADLGIVGLTLFIASMLYMVVRCAKPGGHAKANGSGTREAFLGLAAATLIAGAMENTLAPAAEFTSVLWVLYAMTLAERATGPHYRVQEDLSRSSSIGPLWR
jgi:O-antigen ligase